MSRFDVISHITSASHIREFPRATTSGFISVPALKLAVNQYVPRGYTSSPGDLSIVFCHANGFHKELYEPFFDDLLLQLESIGVRVRGIWSLDAVNQGESGVLNEAVIGDQPCWNDLPRDVLHFINTFASHLPPPIFGMGHSYGGHAIVRTSLLHPSLFTAMIPIDPVIEEFNVPTGRVPAKASARRVDIWPIHADAERYFRSRAFYKSWDPRCLDIHLKHGLRNLPTATYPDKTGVTLKTTKHQEVYTFIRCVGPTGEEKPVKHLEPVDTNCKLKEVVPPVLYIMGGESNVSTPASNKQKVESTPIAEIVVVPGAGHFVPIEKPTETAIIAAPYLKKQLEKWKSDAEQDQKTPRLRQLPRLFLEHLAKL